MGRLAQFVRRAPVTSLLLLACLGVFVAMCVKGGFEPSGPAFDEATLRRFGGLDPERAWLGEPWRLLSAGLVHGDPLHILFNVWALFALGPLLERVLSPPRALLLMVGSQLGCTATHLCFGSMTSLVGASGIACGMLGGLIVSLVRRHDDAAVIERRTYIFWAVQIVVFSVVFPNVSVLGHLGGGVAGAALMVGLEPSPEHRLEHAVSVFFACVLIGVAVRFALVQPERANWNLAQGMSLHDHHQYRQAVPFLQRGEELGYGDYRPEMVHAVLGDALVELHDSDAGLRELAEGAEGGSSFAADRLASVTTDPHQAIAYVARALEVAPTEPVNRPQARDEAERELVQELLVSTIDLAAQGDLPTATDLKPLVHLPEGARFVPVAEVRAVAQARAGDRHALQALAATDTTAAHLLAELSADAGGADLAAEVRRALLATPGLFDGGPSVEEAGDEPEAEEPRAE